jgi:hypothetical protein
LEGLILYESFWLLLIELIPFQVSKLSPLLALPTNMFLTSLSLLLYMGLVRSFYLAISGDNRARVKAQKDVKLFEQEGPESDTLAIEIEGSKEVPFSDASS